MQQKFVGLKAETQLQTEVDFLNIAAKFDIPGLCHIVDHEDLQIDGVLDSTNNNRGFVDGLFNRVHRRILFEEVAEPITKFLTLTELISAIRDCIEGE